MEKLRNQIKRLTTQVMSAFRVRSVRMDLMDFQKLEPGKYQKTLQLAVKFYKKNDLAIDFIKRESHAYWLVLDYLRYGEFDSIDLVTAFEGGNLNTEQTWRESFNSGDMHWQTVAWSLGDSKNGKKGPDRLQPEVTLQEELEEISE